MLISRRELYHIQRELLRERTRCKALEEELENPMNIHRWRKLEGSDPSTYEMIQKIHTLQRRLIVKTEEVSEQAESHSVHPMLLCDYRWLRRSCWFKRRRSCTWSWSRSCSANQARKWQSSYRFTNRRWKRRQSKWRWAYVLMEHPKILINIHLEGNLIT